MVLAARRVRNKKLQSDLTAVLAKSMSVLKLHPSFTANIDEIYRKHIYRAVLRE